jgi:hypothetical protein
VGEDETVYHDLIRPHTWSPPPTVSTCYIHPWGRLGWVYQPSLGTGSIITHPYSPSEGASQYMSSRPIWGGIWSTTPTTHLEYTSNCFHMLYTSLGQARMGAPAVLNHKVHHYSAIYHLRGCLPVQAVGGTMWWYMVLYSNHTHCAYNPVFPYVIYIPGAG